MKWFILTLAAMFAFSASASAEDKKADGPVKLKLVAKTDKYKFDTGGKTPEEFKKFLDDAAKKAKDGALFNAPKPPAVDLVLEIVNTSKDEVTIYVGGDSNVFTFELTGGAGVVDLNSGLAFTADFKLPKAVTLAAGKSYELPIKQLSDGHRGMGRFIYWTGPGEYKLSATYALAGNEGGKGALLKSEPVKITVTEK